MKGSAGCTIFTLAFSSELITKVPCQRAPGGLHDITQEEFRMTCGMWGAVAHQLLSHLESLVSLLMKNKRCLAL